MKNYVETLVKHHLQAEPEAGRMIAMHVAPEIADVRCGVLLRSPASPTSATRGARSCSTS